MGRSTSISGITLHIKGMPPALVTQFDGSSGHFDGPSIKVGLNEGTIFTTDNKPLWSGLIYINSEATFDLCVAQNNGNLVELFRWNELPPFFTVFDGGYESLSNEKVSILLDDLITFNVLVKVRCHFHFQTFSKSLPGRWTTQEGLKEISEIFIALDTKQQFLSNQLILVELELFETVYFFVGIYECTIDDGIIVSLTSHFYKQQNRVGRRIPIEPISIGDLKLLEVSDFGLKVSKATTLSEEETTLTILISQTEILFQIVYKKVINEKEMYLGLKLLDFSKKARKSWQEFILQYQYPLLAIRNQSYHDQVWELLEEAGYFKDIVGEMVLRSKEKIQKEWKIIDSNGPDYGTSVISKDDSGNVVATIGVSRVSQNVWVAQAAAMLDKPELLAHSGSVYAWRTRNILQQVDGEYHLAFFAANKPFLDRFFRKFFLNCSENDKQFISWTEWIPHYIFLDSSKIDAHKNVEVEPFPPNLNLFNGKHEAGIQCIKIGKITVFISRPHQHLAQFLSSSWSEEQETLESILPTLSILYAMGNDMVVVMTKLPLEGKSNSSHQIYQAPPEVMWTCKRELLSDFLSNSLRSLEIMNRKYGHKKTT